MTVKLREDIESLNQRVSSLEEGGSSTSDSIITFDGEKYWFGDKVIIFQYIPPASPNSAASYLSILVDEEDVATAIQGGGALAPTTVQN